MTCGLAFIDLGEKEYPLAENPRHFYSLAGVFFV
jgi:hypothetical protein